MEFIAQIFTGGWHTPLYETQQILDRLDHICGMLRLKAVIIGWHIAPDLYKAVRHHLKEKNIALYLWLPAFSEIGELGDADKAENLFGTSSSYHLQEGESFQFFCPSSEKNLQLIESIYDRYFSNCGFDGVFLDKIRGQSFATGREDIFGCSCGRCQKLFGSNGFDVDVYSRFLNCHGIPEALRVEALTPEKVIFAHQQTRDFFSAKTDICSQQVMRLTEDFRHRGLQVGLDLYAPALSNLVGQDFRLLCSKADFVKPMMYRKTQAPAGLEFELSAFWDALTDGDSTKEVLRDFPITGDAFLQQQLKAIEPKLLSKTCPGLEINYRADIARTDPQYIQNSLHIFENCGIKTAVLSWDMMLAPDSHLTVAGSLQK